MTRPFTRTYARLRARGSKVSLVDCLMYAVARRIEAPFIMADADLRGEPGVVLVAARG